MTITEKSLICKSRQTSGAYISNTHLNLNNMGACWLRIWKVGTVSGSLTLYSDVVVVWQRQLQFASIIKAFAPNTLLTLIVATCARQLASSWTNSNSSQHLLSMDKLYFGQYKNASSHSQIHSVSETLSEHALRNERTHSFHHLDCSLLCRSRRKLIFFFSL